MAFAIHTAAHLVDSRAKRKRFEQKNAKIAKKKNWPGRQVPPTNHPFAIFATFCSIPRASRVRQYGFGNTVRRSVYSGEYCASENIGHNWPRLFELYQFHAEKSEQQRVKVNRVVRRRSNADFIAMIPDPGRWHTPVNECIMKNGNIGVIRKHVIDGCTHGDKITPSWWRCCSG